MKVLLDLGLVESDCPDIKINRTHAGYWQRAEGAWSWWVGPADNPGMEIAGSPHTCQEIIKAHRQGRVAVSATMTAPELCIEGEAK